MQSFLMAGYGLGHNFETTYSSAYAVYFRTNFDLQ